MKKLLSFLLCWDLLPVWLTCDITIIQEFRQGEYKLKCRRCGRYYAMSAQHQAILPWDEDFERIICDMYGLSRTLR